MPKYLPLEMQPGFLLWLKETARPKTAKIPPPTIPPIPMAIAAFSPIFYSFISVFST